MLDALWISLAINAVALGLVLTLEVLTSPRPHAFAERLPGFTFIIAASVVSVIISPPVFELINKLRPVAILDLSTIPAWAQVAIAFVLIDFLSYWEHRFEHRFFWPVHVVHHAPKQLHVVQTWGHPLQRFPMHVFKFLPLALIQFSTPVVPAFVLIFLITQSFWLHSSTRLHLGPLRWLLVDPRFHRLHHGLEPQYHDKNFGIVFSVWDRMFGTAMDPVPGVECEVGVADVAEPRNFVEFLVMPFKYTVDRYRSASRRAPTRSGNASPEPLSTSPK